MGKMGSRMGDRKPGQPTAVLAVLPHTFRPPTRDPQPSHNPGPRPLPPHACNLQVNLQPVAPGMSPCTIKVIGVGGGLC